MNHAVFPVIDPAATGENIRRLRLERGLTVRDLQRYFGFEEPRAIYKWQKGETLPSVDNLYALSTLLGVPMEEILVSAPVPFYRFTEQQAESCCSVFCPASGAEVRYRLVPPLYGIVNAAGRFVMELAVHRQCRRPLGCGLCAGHLLLPESIKPQDTPCLKNSKRSDGSPLLAIAAER